MKMMQTAKLANFDMLTTLEKIQTHLLFYGITESVEIEKEAEEDILMALEVTGVENVRLEDGALVIEYKE
jgi:hypothetical protein